MAALKVAYVLLRFPRLTETFVAEEMRRLHLNGVDLRIYSILRSQEELVHSISQELLMCTYYAADVFSGSLWLAQLHYLSKAPAKYVALLATVLREPAPRFSFYLKRMDVFLKGAWIARQLEHEQVDIVHTHFAWLSTIAAMVISKLLELPFTVTAHAYDIYSEKNDLLPLASRLADGIVTISDANKAAILAMNPKLQDAQVRVLRCGIDLDYFRPSPAKKRNKALQITSVGRLLPKKGHEYLIRACAELAAQQVDFQCVIVGDGELRQSLQALIGQLHLNERVVLAGAQTREWVRERLCESDLFVLACATEKGGDRDGIPISIMEAMAMGVPVISTPVSGIPELVQHEKTGLLVPEQNAGELANAMMRLAKDEALRYTIAQNALELVHREHDIEQNAKRLQAFFEETARARESVGGSAT